MIEFIPHLPETRITPFVRIRRERKLTVPGELGANPGMRIGALDILARAYKPSVRRALSLTRVLGVRETDVHRRLLKAVGDPVEAREIIIAKPINFGIQRLVYRAPEAGQVAAIQGSWMILDIYGPPLDLPALYRGTVIEVTGRLGGIIEAQGALVQGAWGSGRQAVGMLRMTAKSPSDILDAGGIDVDARGAILITGSGVTRAALEKANELQASGIITGSLAPELQSVALEINVPVMVTEGFGTIPMSAPAFELLTTLNGQEAAINAEYRPRGGDATRPEVFVPLSLNRMPQDKAESDALLAALPGGRVRGACEPYLGRVGGLPAELALQWVTTAGGVQLPAVPVEWQDAPGERELVPWTNLELVG
jgi:hypothetical protein